MAPDAEAEEVIALENKHFPMEQGSKMYLIASRWVRWLCSAPQRLHTLQVCGMPERVECLTLLKGAAA